MAQIATVTGKSASSGAAGSGSATLSGGETKQYATYEMVRDMIAQSEEKVTSKLESIETRIDQKLSKLDNVPTTSTMIFTVGGALVAGLSLLMAILAFAGDRFDGGLGYGANIGDKIFDSRLAIAENEKRDEETRDRVDLLLERMDKVLVRLGEDTQTDR